MYNTRQCEREIIPSHARRHRAKVEGQSLIRKDRRMSWFRPLTLLALAGALAMPMIPRSTSAAEKYADVVLAVHGGTGVAKAEMTPRALPRTCASARRILTRRLRAAQQARRHEPGCRRGGDPLVGRFALVQRRQGEPCSPTTAATNWMRRSWRAKRSRPARSQASRPSRIRSPRRGPSWSGPST